MSVIFIRSMGDLGRFLGGLATLNPHDMEIHHAENMQKYLLVQQKPNAFAKLLGVFV